MKRDDGSIGKLILALVVVFVLLRILSGNGPGPFSAILNLFRYVFWFGLLAGVVVLAIVGAVIWFTVKDNKYRKQHDPPNVTPKGAKEAAKNAKANAKTKAENDPQGKNGTKPGQPEAGKQTDSPSVPANPVVADRSKTYEKTPEGIKQMLTDYSIDCVLGPVAADALKQKERLETQQESYRRLVERRFGKGTLTTEKYISVEKSSNDALQNSYLRIANRMEAFDTKEYLNFTSGAYKEDAIPDDVQEQRYEIYRANLQYMKDRLADNEYILAGMDRLMLKLADSDNTEIDTTAEIKALEEQLAYYKKHI